MQGAGTDLDSENSGGRRTARYFSRRIWRRTFFLYTGAPGMAVYRGGLSGDTGFYSGAKKLEQLLSEASGQYDMEVIPGICSVSYLAARLQTTWEDASTVSLHGREENFIQTVSRSRKTFLLLGGKDAGSRMLRKLREYGLDDVTVSVGSRLSCSNEKIISGRPAELREEDVEGLCTALIENPRPEIRWNRIYGMMRLSGERFP